jgi:CMP-N-acetylneuraminic acid synthetase
MIAWAIRACLGSRAITNVFVTTDDPEIAAVSEREGASVIQRPAALAADEVYKHDAVVHALDEIDKTDLRPDVILSVQANSPEITSEMLDRAIQLLRERHLHEVFSVSPELIQNGAFRVLVPKAARQRTLSVYCAVMIADVTDVHTKADAAFAEGRLRRRMQTAG